MTSTEGGALYESNGEKYFVVDGHMHYWNAAPDNWVPGAEQYAKGWIECFHAYQGLGPPETHWSLDHFEKYSEDDLMKDVFEDGYVHKGPTIWPLDKDAFDVSDVDHAATDFPELNFIVEHVGLPRIEDFCFMATQEPNVYAGLSVVIGGLMHARPNFFAKVMGELLFWVGEDKMTFGSDYGIWEPKWQGRGVVDLGMPDREGVARL